MPLEIVSTYKYLVIELTPGLSFSLHPGHCFKMARTGRFFLKRIIGLPPSTPSYMLGSESGYCDLFLYTVMLHFNYKFKF